MESLKDLQEDYKHLLIQGLGTCDGELSKSREVLDIYREHIRNRVVRGEVERFVLTDKPPTPSGFRRPRCAVVALVILLGAMVVLLTVPEVSDVVVMSIRTTPCLMESNFFSSELGRPLFHCDICRDLKEVPVVYNVSREEFSEKFAYHNVPVLVKQATVNWSAIGTFSFKYFQGLYREASIRFEKQKIQFEDREGPECQFFPYTSGFEKLMDAMEMSDERASYQEGQDPWYIGWSNCDTEVQEELRRHYHRPYFLPTESETVPIDWIFMGGTGRGAPMHLDTVGRPSWQAQISGKKTWHLEPPPECESVCHPLAATMETGDIIVVDTNQWYHSTYIHPGALSITIGSEYD